MNPRNENENFASLVPSVTAFYQEGSKIVYAPNPIPFRDVANRLGVVLAEDDINRLTPAVGNIDLLSNLAKFRVARVLLLRKLSSNSSDQNIIKIAQFLTADSAIRTTTRSIVQSSQETNSPESALTQDLNYIRDSGGAILERRLLDGKIDQTQAIAIASSITSSSIKLSPLEKGQLVNLLTSSPISSVHPKVGSLSPQQVSDLVTEYKIRRSFINQLLTTSIGPIPPSSRLAFSDLLPLVNASIDSYKKSTTAQEALLLIEQIAGKDKMPDKITSLSQIADIVIDHPEIRAVSFDLYDTLVQWTSNQLERRTHFSQLLGFHLGKKFGIKLDQAALNQLTFAAWEKRWQQYQSKGIEVKLAETLGWITDDILKISPLPPDKVVDFKKRLSAEMEKLWYTIELDTAVAMPESLETLRKLKTLGLKLCLTSNASWTDSHVERVLHRFGLKKYFDSVSLSAQIGKMKDPNIVEFFHHSWGKVATRSDQVLHIGDNPWSDVQGARNAGAAVHYTNPHAFSVIETEQAYYQDPSLYKTTALEFHRVAQNEDALRYIEEMMDKNQIPLAERERVRSMSKEVYQKVRDIIGPAYFSMSEVILKKISDREADMCLCLARDGLPLAIMQKLMLHLDPDRYPNASSDQIKYAYISRVFLDRLNTDTAFRQSYLKYLQHLGTDSTKRIILTDIISGSGKTYAGLKQLLANKEVEGYFFSAPIDSPNAVNAHHYLYETTGQREIYVSLNNMLLLMEALFSGPYESPTNLKSNQANISWPEMKRKSLPPEILARGLSESSLLLLHKISIRGFIDCVQGIHRKRLLGIPDPDPKMSMSRYFAFISQEQLSPIWQDIWRSSPWQDNDQWLTPVLLKDREDLPGAWNSKIS